MKSSYEKIDPTHIKLEVTINKSDWHKAADRVYRAFAAEVKIPGFRPGRAPRKVIDQYIGAKEVFDSIKEEAVNSTILAAIRKQELQPIARPDFDLSPLDDLHSIPGDDEITYYATVEIWPDVPDFSYKGLKVLVKKREITEEDIEKAINGIRLRTAEKNEVDDRSVEDGDWVTFHFRGVVEPDPGAEAESGDDADETDSDEKPDGPFVMEDTYSIHVGQDTSIPGISESIIGMKKDEENDFEIFLPDDFPREDMRGRRMQSHAVIKRIEEMKMPELTDEFIKEKIGLENLDALKENITQSMEKSHDDLKRKEANEALEEFFSNTVTLQPPGAFIESRKEVILENMRSYYSRMDQDLDEILRDKEKAEDIRKRIAEEANSQIRLEMVYDEIARNEKIEVEIDEVKNYIYMMQSMNRLKEKDVKRLIKDENFLLSIRNDLKNQKVIDFLYENSEITEVDDMETIEKRVEETPKDTEPVAEEPESVEVPEESPAEAAEVTETETAPGSEDTADVSETEDIDENIEGGGSATPPEDENKSTDGGD